MASDDEISALIMACARMDRSALARLHAAEAARMTGVAERMLRRRALADEAVQDAFVQAWRRAGSFDPARGNGRTWLYTVLRNRCLNILRGESRLELPGDDAAFDRPSEEDDPETVLGKLDEAGRLRGCLSALEPRRRAAILLAFAQGLSHGEVAGRLGLPLGTVKSWIRRGLLQLRECLA
jgi:RNA polymerase sigma-70 factor (ECF subfamily)